jgi:hypothetical protein
VNQKTMKTTHMRDYRRRKREQGICIYGGCWATSSKIYCTAHRDITNLKALTYKRQRTRKKRLQSPKMCKFTGCVDMVQGPAIKYCLYHSNTTTYFVMRLKGQVIQGLCHQGFCTNIPVEGITLCKDHHELSLTKNRISAAKIRAKKYELASVQVP